MKKKTFALFIAAAIIILLLDIIRPEFSSDAARNESISTILTRTIGALLFLYLAKQTFPKVFTLNKKPTALFCILPALAVAINNAPLLGLASGKVKAEGGIDLFLLALECLTVGFFEEAAFRGYLFPIILQKSRKRSLFFSTVISSLVFAAVHLMNLFYGSSPGAVLLQVGYSFLIGGMCAIVLLKSHSLILCALIHAVYNFGGALGTGQRWDAVTVTITALLGVGVCVFMLITLAKIKKEEVNALLPK